MSAFEVCVQQLIIGFSNGMIIALIALGYTMVYGIIELINFAHGDLFMLGAYFALTLVGLFGLEALANAGTAQSIFALVAMVAATSLFCAALNWGIDRVAYRPLRGAPRLAPLVSAIGVSFILMNLGLFWGGVPMEVFGGGSAAGAAAPKSFPDLVSNANLLGAGSAVSYSAKDLLILLLTAPLMIGLTLFVRFTRIGKAMRAVAQNPVAARLMGVDIDRVIGATFAIGGALGGAASIVFALYNNTIHFQMGYRAGLDAFTAAVLGGIGSMPGACCGGLLIGLVRAMSDQYIATKWTNVVVFAILIAILVFRPTGLLGARMREKV